MIDFVRLNLKSGKGGDGAVSFERLPKKPKGPPDGGDGGDGGNVYLTVDKDLTTLLPYRYKKDFKTPDGGRGGENRKKGKRGDDLLLEVPVGTKVTNQKGEAIADLTKVGEQVMIVRGGKGGRGNAHVKKSEFNAETSEFPDIWHWFERGEESQEAKVTLELKLLADIGLVGLPNAGKSTLLSKLTAAHPKIASYAFTTLEPNLGVMKHHTSPRLRGASKGKELVIADIPGLIEGASKGKGLGDQFLRHVERTKLLAHLISAESEDPARDIETINNELKEYSKELLDKPQIYLLNKIDILDEKTIKEKLSTLKKKKIDALPISAAIGEGLEELKNQLLEKI